MEVTGRGDVGADLHAPALDDAGHESPTYSLVREVQEGDIVFHYEKSEHAIRLWSVAHGGFWEAETVWGTPRSTGPTGHPVPAYPRPGLWQGLHGPFPLTEPLTLDELRVAADDIRRARNVLEGRYTGSLYFPFQLRSDGPRAAQGYLLKMPAELVDALPKLAAVASLATPPVELPPPHAPQAGLDLGAEYTPADEEAAQPDRDAFPVDPAVVERGVRSHAQLQNMLAAHLAAKGLAPRMPGPENPPWDVLWRESGTVWVAEVKSLTLRNEERQLRLGLGQLLRYRHRLDKQGLDAHAVLMVERGPLDGEWQELCDALGVVLVWPDVLASRLPQRR